MTENCSRLLREISLLLRRYRPKDFEELAALIGTPSFTTALSQILSEVAASRRQNPPVKRGTRKREDLMEKIRIADEAKYAVLRSMKERILDTKLNPKLADLVRILQVGGVPLSKQSFRRRDDLVQEFLQAASSMSTEQLTEVLTKLDTVKTTGDLRSWSDLIFPKKDGS